jgi:hypothetical protein
VQCYTNSSIRSDELIRLEAKGGAYALVYSSAIDSLAPPTLPPPTRQHINTHTHTHTQAHRSRRRRRRRTTPANYTVQ